MRSKIRFILLLVVLGVAGLAVWQSNILPSQTATPVVVVVDNVNKPITGTLPALSSKTIPSTYPQNTPLVFTIPVQSAAYDPHKAIAQAEKNLASRITETKKINDFALYTLTLPAASMSLANGKQATESGLPFLAVWLANSQPFRGVTYLQPFFPNNVSQTQNFIVMALLDNKPIRLAIAGSKLDDRISLNLKSGERALFDFETEPLPKGAHSLTILTFNYAFEKTEDAFLQDSLGRKLHQDFYKVYVATTTPTAKVDFNDWNIGKNPFLGLYNHLGLIDLAASRKGTGFSAWKPATVQPGQKINYQISLTNTDVGDREYCLIALLDYKLVPIEGDKLQTCGIVKEGQWGIIDSSFQAPSQVGTHHFEIVRIENPLMKSSYLKSRSQEDLVTYSSSGRVLIKVAKPK